MELECGDLAECFGFYLSEQGFDEGVDLPDDEHKTLIREQFNSFKNACNDNL